MRRSDLYFADLSIGGNVGSEQGGLRPVVVIKRKGTN
ncbi:type II toxin-antitoxin system PemK/MazF family toxin [Caldifermentibacillus hisashii]